LTGEHERRIGQRVILLVGEVYHRSVLAVVADRVSAYFVLQNDSLRRRFGHCGGFTRNRCSNQEQKNSARQNLKPVRFSIGVNGASHGSFFGGRLQVRSCFKIHSPHGESRPARAGEGALTAFSRSTLTAISRVFPQP
jgi:hypothetical protein